MGGQPPSCSGCPLYNVGTGFVLDSGNPATAKLAILLEAPGRDELHWHADPDEIERRRKRYPEMEEKFLKIGVPVVGRSGSILWLWGLAPLQIHRKDVFVANTLRCLPPKVKDSQYPTGDIRKAAEAHCRQYDRWDEFTPTVSVINIHPAAIARECSPLPLMLKTFEKAKDFAAAGERPLVLCGGKSVHYWLGYGSTIRTWLGHIAPEVEILASNREERRRIGMATKCGPKQKKVKRLTARAALELLIENAALVQRAEVNSLDGEVSIGDFCYHINKHISERQYAEILEIIAGKVKKGTEGVQNPK